MQPGKKALLAYLMLSLFLPYHSVGKELTLHDALNVHVYNTKYVKGKRLALANILMECDNFRKSMLPSLSLNLTPVSFDRSMRLLQSYSTGEYSNVEEYSNTTSGGVSIMQKIAATGGVLTLGSSLNFLREFTTNNNSFSSTPMFLSYSQALFGGRKSLRLESTMSRLKNEIAMKDFCASVYTEQQKILALYLNAYSYKHDIDFYTQAVNMGDSLLMHAKLRMDMGKITEYEYNMVELQQLDNKMALERSCHDYSSSMRLLENELSLQDIELALLSVEKFPQHLDEGDVLDMVNRNNPEYQKLEIERVSAEYALHQVRVNNRFNANISLNYGLNQYANTLADAYRHPDQRQAVSVTFSVPVFQWGINRNKLKIAQNEYETTLLEQEYAIDNFKEEIHDDVFGYNMSRELMDAASRKYELSARQYSFAAMRFNTGKIAAIELTDANREYLQAKQNYISVLKDLFTKYYKIRHLAMHDFMEGKDMLDLIRESDVE